VGSKSVSVLVKLPAGLNLTVPVKVSLLVNGVWTIQDYVNFSGNRWFYNLDDEDARVRTESVTVALHEITPGGQSYSFTLAVRIEPLYDISISPLRFTLLSDTDWIGASECLITWWPPEGGLEEHELSIYAGDTHRFESFARVFSEVSVVDNLRMPIMQWVEKDTELALSYDPPPDSNGPLLPLEPGRTLISFIRVDEGDGYNGSDGSARFSYSIITTLRTYHPSAL
jgi:hypothetical protein